MNLENVNYPMILRGGSESGGENGSTNTVVIILTVIIVVLIIVVIGTLCSCCTHTSSTTTYPTSSAMTRVSKKQKQNNTTLPKKNVQPNTSSSPRHVRPPPHVKTGVNTKATRFETTSSTPLPSQQLMSTNEMPDLDLNMEYMSNNNVSSNDLNYSAPTYGSNSLSNFEHEHYRQSSSSMSASTDKDVKDISVFMPNINDAKKSDNGPTDPSTGLPLFTSGKLTRSQLLGGHGMGSFLRKQQDPMSGYRRLGNNLCGSLNSRRDLDMRRTQFNEARLADPNGDPVLFQTSEFAYF